MNSKKGSFALWTAALAGVAGLLGLLFVYSPEQYHLYPRCALYTLTGLQCPGCGGLRALHHLLHGRLALAFAFNPLLVIGAPFVAAGFIYYLWCKAGGRQPWNPFQHTVWTWLILGIVIGFSILRNLPLGL